jgi:hypothetical protein
MRDVNYLYLNGATDREGGIEELADRTLFLLKRGTISYQQAFQIF